MTNVNYTEDKDYLLAFEKLSDFIARLNKVGSKDLLNELLTDAERIMLVKRFAAIVMLHNDYSSYRVSTILSISISTAQRIHKNYDDQAYHELLKHIRPKENKVFCSLIEDLIMAQVSPRARARLMNRVL